MKIYNKNAAAATIIATVWLVIPTGCSLTQTATPSDTSLTAAANDISQDEYAIILNGDTAQFSADGVSVDNNIVTVTAAGRYTLSGTLDGQVIVNADKASDVTLVLDNASISSGNSPAIYFLNADNAVLELADGTSNTLSDGSEYSLAENEEEPNAALFSKCDLTISGSGQLSVTGSYKHAVFCKDDLVLSGGTVYADAVKDGIKARDSIALTGGSYTITAGEDGLRTTNVDDAEKGSILISGGSLNITAANDGIQSVSSLDITDGSINIVSGGGSANAPVKTERFGGWGRAAADNEASQSEEASSKGIKAASDLTISGADITVDSADDAIHSNTAVTIENGTISLSSVDDGVHADENVSISGGTLVISKSYEGIEGKNIVVNGGNISVRSSDDGFNATDGSSSSAFGGFGQNGFEAVDDCGVVFNGGYTVIDADGDGIDSNGTLGFKAGTVLVNGPTNNGNGALDYAGECSISGGILIAAGSSGMAQMPSESSPQCSLMIAFDSSQPSGATVSLTEADGSAVLSFTPSKAYDNIVISAPALIMDKTYTVLLGGTQINAKDGFSADSISSAEKLTDITLSKTSTAVTETGSEYSGGMAFGGMGGGRPGGNPPDFSQGRPQRPDRGGFGGNPPDMPQQNKTLGVTE